MELDKDLAARQEARSLAAAARKAQHLLADMEQSQLDAIVEAMAKAFAAESGMLAEMAVRETGFGKVEDKVKKNLFAARDVAKATMGMGMNKFAPQAPVLIVISEGAYCKSAALGAKVKGNDYRSIDIGIAAAYLTAEAAAQGLGSCILGWLDDAKIRSICGLDTPVRLVITLGYPLDAPREKKRKDPEQLFRYL